MQTEQKHQPNAYIFMVYRFEWVRVCKCECKKGKECTGKSIDVDFKNRQCGAKKSEIEKKYDNNDEMVS